MTKILIVDDDVELCELVGEYLSREGFEVEAVHNGDKGLERALSGEHALVVLDLMLPGMTGLDVLRRLRGESRAPVLILTARGEDVDRIVGLEIGADDYLPKPFNPRELVARIRAILRRSQAVPAPMVASITVGDVELDPGARSVTRNGERLELTAVEFSLLEALMRSAGQVVTREYLAQTVLGRRFMAYDRSIDMHVSKLRKKLGPAAADGRERIKTIRGVGYIYARSGDTGD
ncbi:MAG TPA: response regulator transcription factor [Terriglobales bacterium]|nr:response regulator transcription factor [Terriglobales bacterium]